MTEGSQLIGTWRAQEIGGRPLGDDVASTIAFGADGRVAGGAGVNRFGGPYQLDGDARVIGQGPEQVRLLRVDDLTDAQGGRSPR